VYTASADGEILKWDVQTMIVKDKYSEKIRSLKNLKFYNGFLWCGKNIFYLVHNFFNENFTHHILTT
jgi:hypothetical protein